MLTLSEAYFLLNKVDEACAEESPVSIFVRVTPVTYISHVTVGFT